MAQRAGKAAPAVAVVGALAAVTQIHDFLPPGQPTGAGHLTTDERAQPRVLRQPSARLPLPVRYGPYVPRHASTPGAGGASHSPPSRGHAQAGPGRPRRHHHKAAPSGAVRCSGSGGGPLPANYAAIVGFLTAHGYSGNAAAGIAGNIYQESGGNPESTGSGGGGLIGWTPLPPGLVTGNPAADLRTQLEAILTFNQQWSAYIPALNNAATPAEAADIYVTYFERAGIPAAASREAAANAVAAACGLLARVRTSGRRCQRGWAPGRVSLRAVSACLPRAAGRGPWAACA